MGELLELPQAKPQRAKQNASQEQPEKSADRLSFQDVIAKPVTV